MFFFYIVTDDIDTPFTTIYPSLTVVANSSWAMAWTTPPTLSWSFPRLTRGQPAPTSLSEREKSLEGQDRANRESGRLSLRFSPLEIPGQSGGVETSPGTTPRTLLLEITRELSQGLLDVHSIYVFNAFLSKQLRLQWCWLSFSSSWPFFVFKSFDVIMNLAVR